MTLTRHSPKRIRSTFQKRPTLSRPQWEIYSQGWKPEARFRTVVAGRRFGKSFLAVEEIRRAVREAVRNNIDPDNEIWYCAPYLNQARRVFWKRLQRGVPASWVDGKPNKSNLSITLKSGHIIRLVGLDNYDALRGSGLWFAVVDEWADCPFLAWTETLRPMLSTANGHALKIGTPKGYDHLYDDWCAGQPGAKDEEGNPITDHKSFLYTTEQGGNVPKKEIEAARRNLDDRTFEQEYQAEFKNFVGRCIHAFERRKHVKACPMDPCLPIWIGMDFNINPMTAIVGQQRGNEDWIVGEIIIPTSNTDVMAAEIVKRYGRGGSVKHITVYPDPAGKGGHSSSGGKTDISILQAAGFRVDVMTSHPLVRDRITLTNARFEAADGTISLYVDHSCQKLIESLERHIYKPGTSDPLKSTGFDHCVDGLGYYLFPTYFPKTKPQTVSAGRFMQV